MLRFMANQNGPAKGDRGQATYYKFVTSARHSTCPDLLCSETISAGGRNRVIVEDGCVVLPMLIELRSAGA